jgi:hypothetical protein
MNLRKRQDESKRSQEKKRATSNEKSISERLLYSNVAGPPSKFQKAVLY